MAPQFTQKFVKPASVDLLKLGAHYAMSSLFESYPDNTRIYAYSVDNKDYRLEAFGQNAAGFRQGAIHLGNHAGLRRC